MSGFTTVGFFLFSLFFSLLTFVLWARFILRYFRVSALHPLSLSISSFTDPIVKPISGLFKSSNTRANRYDWACFSMIIIVELLKLSTLSWLVFGSIPSGAILLLWTLADVIIQPCNLLFYAILIRVIMSWVNPHWRNPLADILVLVTEPVLSKTKRAIPVISGIDFSPFVVLIILKVITLFIGASIPASLV